MLFFNFFFLEFEYILSFFNIFVFIIMFFMNFLLKMSLKLKK